MKRNLLPLACLSAALSLGVACSDEEAVVGPEGSLQGAAIVWTVQSQTDTTASSPFVFVEITFTSRPADTTYVHVTVESLDFDPVDFAGLRLPQTPGEGSDSFTILGRMPIWTDWRMVIDVWSEHAEAVTDTVFWDAIDEDGGATSAGEAARPPAVLGFERV